MLVYFLRMTSSSCHRVSVLLLLNLMFLAANLLTGDQQGRDNVLAWQATLVADRSCSKRCDRTRFTLCCLIKLGSSIQYMCLYSVISNYSTDCIQPRNLESLSPKTMLHVY